MDAEKALPNGDVNVALAVDVLTRMNALSHEDIESGLRDILGTVGNHLQLDRVGFWDYNENTRQMTRVASWLHPESSTPPLRLSFPLLRSKPQASIPASTL